MKVVDRVPCEFVLAEMNDNDFYRQNESTKGENRNWLPETPENS